MYVFNFNNFFILNKNFLNSIVIICRYIVRYESLLHVAVRVEKRCKRENDFFLPTRTSQTTRIEEHALRAVFIRDNVQRSTGQHIKREKCDFIQ